MEKPFQISSALALTLLIGVIAGLFAFWMMTRKSRPSDSNENDYRPVQSKSALNQIQLTEPLPHYSAELQVKRFKKNGHWQIKLEKSSAPASDGDDLGVLSAQVSAPDATQALYLCNFNGSFNGESGGSKDSKPENITLVTEASCAGGVKLHPDGPVGYSSQSIRQGHLAAFRCKSKSAGYYLSLNSRCESPEDTIIESLGAFLTHDLRKSSGAN